MHIKTGSADFSSPISGSGPRVATVPIIFPTAVDRCAVGLTGYTIGFGDDDDHNYGRVDIAVSGDIQDNVVVVTATLGLRDDSLDYDDVYFGSIEFAVLADLAAVPPRPDLIVDEVEFNQAVQFFRSETYLSAQAVLPDNAIPLYAGKSTGVRVYPDWDADLGLPLAGISGTVTIQPAGGGSATSFDPINGPIAPLAADQINMAVADHTLNFMIPGPLCVGTLEVTVQLFDSANPASKTGLFTRTLVFQTLPQLNLFVVGIHYTAQMLDLAAPTQADFTSQGFAFLQQVYPMGTIMQTGYSTLDWSEDVNFTIGTQGGCGDGMSDLLDQLDDMRGSSNDVYLAVLPPLASIQSPGSNIGGCGHTGAGVVFVDQTADVPHEIGHALGRQHAPCDDGMCSPPPANVDDNYPAYGVFPAGSIGAFGFDSLNNVVLDPAGTFDTMAYRFPQWISAYTYLALAGAGNPKEGGTGGQGGLGGAHALTDVPIETLFLGLQVNRDRSVCRNVSFHFKAVPRMQHACKTYTAELLGIDRKVLLCMALSCDCDSAGHNCWPKRLKTALPFPARSRWLLVYEDERKIYEEFIPLPPKVAITKIDETRGRVVVHWAGEHEHQDDDPCRNCCELWYLVQWFDGDDKVWRGVAPRTKANEMTIPPALLKAGEALAFRILVSCGIATGETIFQVKGKGRQPPGVDIVGLQPEGKLNTVISAVPVDAQGRHVETQGQSWTVDGRQVARGSSIDLRVLPQGVSEVRVFLNTEDDHFTRQWTIERRGSQFHLRGAGEQGHRPLRVKNRLQ